MRYLFIIICILLSNLSRSEEIDIYLECKNTHAFNTKWGPDNKCLQVSKGLSIFFHINNKGWKVDERAYWSTENDRTTKRRIASIESLLGYTTRSCGLRYDSFEQILKNAEMTGIGISDRNRKKISTESYLSSYSSPRSAEVVVKKDSIILGPKQQQSLIAGRYENVTLDRVTGDIAEHQGDVRYDKSYNWKHPVAIDCKSLSKDKYLKKVSYLKQMVQKIKDAENNFALKNRRF